MNMHNSRKSERGAAMVEFAIVLPLLMTLIFGMIEFGVCLYDKAMITNASREGARAGIVFGRLGTTGNPSSLPVNLVDTVVTGFCANNLITFGSSSTVTVTTATSGNTPTGTAVTTNYQNVAQGDYLWVTVTYPYQFLLIPNFVTAMTGTINLTAVTRMRAE